jgi:Nucleotidyltransferase domain
LSASEIRDERPGLPGFCYAQARLHAIGDHEQNRSAQAPEDSRRRNQSDGRHLALRVWLGEPGGGGYASDLDLFIDYDPQTRFNAFDLIGIKQFLEGALGIDVDITTRDGLHPMLRGDIEESAIRVF